MRKDISEKHQKSKANAYHLALEKARSGFRSVIVVSAILNLLMLTGSLYMLQVYDRVLPGGSVPTLIVLFGIVVVLFAFLGFYDFLRARLLSRIALQLDDALNTVAFRKWLKSGLFYADGASNSQIMRDLETVRGFLSGPAVTALADVLFVPLFLGILFIIHPWLGFLTVIGAAIGGAFALINRFLTKTVIEKSQGIDIEERNFTSSSQRNVEIIQAMGMQDAITKRWQEMHHRSLATSQKGSDPSEILAASSRSFRMFLQSCILSLGAFLVLRGEISSGMIIASSILSGRALAPVDQLIGQWRATGGFTAAHHRLSKAFDTDEHVQEWITLPEPTGQISVVGLTKLGMPQGNKEPQPILSDVSFALNPGDAVGVVGKSASGKSTLARLLAGAMPSDSGEIRLDGASLNQWNPKQLGRNIGYLPQTVEMLPGTVFENISRFQSDALEADVIKAAQMAGIHEMILNFPKGYNTRLAEANSTTLLSGGQLQRLGLARAIYGLPKIVLLDEPNSNLDKVGDKALSDAIRTLRTAQSTVIVMAHRPSVLKAVNKLMILNAGKVSAFGDRDALLAQDHKSKSTPTQKLPPSVHPAVKAEKITPPPASVVLKRKSTVVPISHPAQRKRRA